MVLIFRKLYRLLGLVFPLVYFFTDRDTSLFWLVLITSLFLVLEITRLFLPQLNRLISQNFKLMLKPKEAQGGIFGTTYFLVGSLLTVFFFVKVFAITALLFLIFGDAISALVGTKWGKIKIGQKTLEGSLAFLFSCFFIVLVLKSTALGLEVKVGLRGALAATLVELLPLPLNDNLSVPVISALMMTIWA